MSFLWLAIGFNLFTTPFTTYWLATLLVKLHVPRSTAIVSIAIMNAAGILGGTVLSLAIDRFGPFCVLGAAYVGAALSVACIGFAAPNVPVVMLVFVAGFLGLGAFPRISLLAAPVYPTHLRPAGWAARSLQAKRARSPDRMQPGRISPRSCH